MGAEGGTSGRRSGSGGKRPPPPQLRHASRADKCQPAWNPVSLLIERKGGGRSVLHIPTRSAGHGRQTNTVIQAFHFLPAGGFPGFCLLVGLWVVVAKPRDPNAWYVFGIFGFIQCFFDNHAYWNGPVLPFMSVDGDLAFIAFILSMLLFGIYFPEPARLDNRFPWVKWVLIVPAVVFAALDVIIDLGRSVDLRISSWIPGWLHTLNHRTESAIAIICICLFFILLFPKYFTAPRRMPSEGWASLVWGAEIGLTPIFIGVVIAQIDRSFQDAVPAGTSGPALSCSSSFPCPWPTSSSCSAPWMYASCCARARNTRSPGVPSMEVRVALGTLLAFMLFQLVSNPQHSSNVWTWALVLALLFLAMQFGVQQRLSAWIDRKFFREVYSTEQVLTELSEEAGRFPRPGHCWKPSPGASQTRFTLRKSGSVNARRISPRADDRYAGRSPNLSACHVSDYQETAQREAPAHRLLRQSRWLADACQRE